MSRIAIALLSAALLVAGCADDDGTSAQSATTTAGVTTTGGEAGSQTTSAPDAPTTTGADSTGAAPGEGATTTTTPVGPIAPQLGSVEVDVVLLAELNAPVDVVTGPDGALYVAEKGGRIVRLDGERDASLDAEQYLDLSDRVSGGGEQGLLGLEFLDGRLHASYTDGSGASTLTSWQIDAGGRPDPSTEQEVMTVDQPFENHNGGDLAVGPDGFLYWALGDGGSGGDPEGNGQDPGTLLGAILRIDPTPDGDEPYRVPDDNPFVGTDAGRPEVFVWGLRNPWKFSFDRATGDLWIGDVGQNRIEEIDHLPAGEAAGANLGWNAFEGFGPFPGGDEPNGEVVDPVFEYGHDQGVSVTGGYVYRGTAIDGLAGGYVFGDFAGGWIAAIAPRADGTVERRGLLDAVGGVSSFGEDVDGELLITTLEGELLRLVPA